ncbi:GntR family transcriptional regulator [Alcaligenaceae bacterium]|nr:GntR family transcriptional regulator [Alcaligenaceae bacterium]
MPFACCTNDSELLKVNQVKCGRAESPEFFWERVDQDVPEDGGTASRNDCRSEQALAYTKEALNKSPRRMHLWIRAVCFVANARDSDGYHCALRLASHPDPQCLLSARLVQSFLKQAPNSSWRRPHFRSRAIFPSRPGRLLIDRVSRASPSLVNYYKFQYFCPSVSKTMKNPLLANDRSLRVEKVSAPMRQQAVELMRQTITTGRFAPGERLVEKDLCEMLGVSRSLVRESLRQLETEGLIHMVPNQGATVARLPLEQAEQLYRVRAELEALASELFTVHASDADLQELQACIKRLKKTARSTNSAANRLTVKSQLYDCLLKGAGNEVLTQVLNLLNTRIMLLRATSIQQQGRWEQSINELEILVDALLNRDTAAARRAAAQHVANAAEAALTILRGQGETQENSA